MQYHYMTGFFSMCCAHLEQLILFCSEFMGAQRFFFSPAILKREGKNVNRENMFISFYYCLLVEVLGELHHGESFQQERRRVFQVVFSAITSGYQ